MSVGGNTIIIHLRTLATQFNPSILCTLAINKEYSLYEGAENHTKNNKIISIMYREI